MQKIFTTEDSVRFVYDEMPLEESSEFIREMSECEWLREEVAQMNEVKESLNESASSASPELIHSLLRYSASLRVVQSSSTGGSFGVVLN